MSSNNIVDELGENVAGVLAYSLGFVTGVVFYLLAERNDFVRFHAVQSIVVFGGLVAVSLGIGVALSFFSFVPVLGPIFVYVFGLFRGVVGLLGLVLWVLLMIKAYQGERFELPVVGAVASSHA